MQAIGLAWFSTAARSQRRTARRGRPAAGQLHSQASYPRESSPSAEGGGPVGARITHVSKC